MESQEALHIDGSMLEGGGQIMRIAISLSAIMGIPIKVDKIRAGRSSPGLRPQHLTGLELVTDLCGGKLIGGSIGSTEISFIPGPVVGGVYKADPGTAGSVALLMQVAVPVALFADSQVTLHLGGGTNADMAPSIDYMKMVFQPLLEKFGGRISTNVIKRGYFPRGGGRVTVHVNPLGKGQCLKAVQMLRRGPILCVWGAAHVAGTLPMKVAKEMADRACDVIKRKLYGAGTSVGLDITAVKEPADKAMGNGSGIDLYAETAEKCLLGTNSCIRPQINAAEKAATDLVEQIDRGACVDSNAQDQMVLLMALASGTSKILCGDLTLHTKTAIYVTELVTKVKFKEQDGILECTGIGHKSDI